MSFPTVNVWLWRSGGGGWLDVSQLLSQEHQPEISARIEKPGETNAFTAADVSVTFRDDLAGTVKGFILTIQPDSTDYRLSIYVDSAQIFGGIILPNTVVVDEVEGTVSLTAAQDGILLARAGAVSSFSRTYSGTWQVLQPSVADLACLTIREAAGAAIADQFSVGDPIEYLPKRGGDPVAVGTIASIAILSGGSWPSNTYQLWLVDKMATYPPVGATVEVPQSSFWKRGVSIQQAVEYCYQAAGLAPPTGDRFYVGTIDAPTASVFPAMVAVPLTIQGLTGQPLGILPGLGTHDYVTVGTTNGAYDLLNPPAVGYGQGWTAGSSWAPPTGRDYQPVPSEHRGGRNYVLCGPRFFASPADRGQVSIYAYDYSKVTIGQNSRFTLTFQYNKVPKSADYSVTWLLTTETTNDGYTWGNFRQLASSPEPLIGTSDIVRSIYDNPLLQFQGQSYTPTGIWGAGVCPCWDFSSNPAPYVIFTELLVTIDGEWMWALSFCSVPLTGQGQIIRTGSSSHGWIDWCSTPGAAPYLMLFQPDSTLSSLTAHVWNYRWDTGQYLFWHHWLAPLDLKPWTMRFWNTADPVSGYRYLYGLGTSKAGGVSLYYFIEPFGPLSDPALPSMSALQFTSALGAPGLDRPWCDVVTIVDVTRSGANASNYPIAALFDGAVWWVDIQPAQSIPFIDAGNKTAGDILAEIAAAYGAIYYQDSSGNNYFRSRSIPSILAVNYGMPGTTDDPRDRGLISMRSQPIWSQNYQLVTVTNSDYLAVVAALASESVTAGVAQAKATLLSTPTSTTKQTITAYYPADKAVLTGSSYELQVTNSFIASYSHALALASALYGYFSKPSPTIELERELDGRAWDVGRTFHTTVLGTRAQYIIIESSRQILSATVRLQALRMN